MALFTILLGLIVLVIFLKQEEMQRKIRQQDRAIYDLHVQIRALMSMKDVNANTNVNANAADDKKSMPTIDFNITPTLNPAPTSVVNETAPKAEQIEGAMPVMHFEISEESGDIQKDDSSLIMSLESSEQPELVETVVSFEEKSIPPPFTASEADNISKAKENKYASADIPERKISTVYTYNEPQRSRGAFFRSENWVGINLFNRLGALLIIIGAIATATFDGFPEWVRSTILFALAFAVIGIGEYMNRKKPTIASIGVSATGIALIYVAVATSYFGLNTLNMYLALTLCIIAAALGIFLANRYKAEVIGAFALVGGYLPIFALDPFNETMLIGLIVYFVLLSLLSLLLALARKWSIMNIVGFVLTVMGTVYLGWSANAVIALIYACFAFLLYTAIPLIAAYRTGEDLGELDVWLIILNTFISSVVVFLIAYRLDIQHLHAYLCLVFAMIYIGVSYWVSKTLQNSRLQTVFTLTSIAFFVLFVPFYFEQRWFAIAWVLQAAVLSGYGILHSKKVAEYSGLGVLALSFASLVSIAFLRGFTLNYTFFTISALAILLCYLIRGRHSEGYELGYKILSLLNLWIFAMYIMFNYITYDNVITLCVIASFGLAVLYLKAPVLSDRPTKLLAMAIHCAAILGLWIANAVYSVQFLNNMMVINTNGLIFNLLALIIGFSVAVYYYLTEPLSNDTMIYKNVNIANLWLCGIWILNILMREADFFARQPVLIVITFVSAFIITRIKAIEDIGVKIIAMSLHIIGLIWLWFVNGSHTAANILILNMLITIIGFSMVIYYYLTEEENLFLTIYKNINIVNLWLSAILILGTLMGEADFFARHPLLIALTFAGAFIITRVPAIYDIGTKMIAIAMNIIALIWLWVFNSFQYANIGGLIAINGVMQIIALIVLNDLINLLKENWRESHYKIMIFSGYFILAGTQTMMVQGDVSFNSAIISIIYGVLAFAWIVLGFYFKNKFIRKIGLFLAMASVAKLLIVDTWGLSTEMRIVSYISLGLILMLTSFIYQKLSKIIDET
ncbi:MAG: DUF2339 domain-containing protein [Defluviitaleaceae bacterium]|nr:DUF2339 domain-containing protein [Defluviitaleaceae bacterium]